MSSAPPLRSPPSARPKKPKQPQDDDVAVMSSPSDDAVAEEAVVVSAGQSGEAKPKHWGKVKKSFKTTDSDDAAAEDSPVPVVVAADATPKMAMVAEQVVVQNRDPRKRVTIHETVQKLKEKMLKKRMYKELVIYLIFLVIFLVSIFMARRVHEAHFIEAALRDALIDEEFLEEDVHILKTFADINSYQELWQWIQGPMFNALNESKWYNDDPYQTVEKEHVYLYNKIVGGVRLRQLRVKPHSCHIAPSYKPIVGDDCYFFYDSDSRETEPFGPRDPSRGPADKYKYSDGSETGSVALLGKVSSSYEAGGYVVDIPLDKLEEKLEELKGDLWLDRQTRALVVSINFLNVHLSNHVATATFLIEMSPGGQWELTSRVSVIRIEQYVTEWDWARLGLDIVVYVFYLYYCIMFVVEARRTKKREGSYWPFINRWNFVEFVNLVVLLVVFIMHAVYFQWHSSNPVNFNTVDYINIEKLSNLYIQIYNVNSFNVFIMVIKVFKYLRLNLRMSLLWKTLDFALFDLLGFFMLFLVVLLAFTLMGHLLFGPELREFDTIGRAVQTMFEMILGNVDYESLKGVNRVLAPFFFWLFVLLCYFSLANMFLAIINDAYEKIHEKVRDSTKYTLRTLIKKRLHDIRNMYDDMRTSKKETRKKKLSKDEIIGRLAGLDKDQSEISRDDLVQLLGDEVAADEVLYTQSKLRARKMRKYSTAEEVEMQEMMSDGMDSAPMSPMSGRDVRRSDSTSSFDEFESRATTGGGVSEAQYNRLLSEMSELKAMVRVLALGDK